MKQVETTQLATLQKNYFGMSRIVDAPHWKGLSESPSKMAFMREEITASLVSVLDSGDLRADHLAHQSQMASMRRIDRLIDEHSDKLMGLQELCEKSNLSLAPTASFGRSGRLFHCYRSDAGHIRDLGCVPGPGRCSRSTCCLREGIGRRFRLKSKLWVPAGYASFVRLRSDVI